MKVGIFGQFYHKNSEIYIQRLLDLLEKEKIDVLLEEGFFKIVEDNDIIQKKYLNFSTFTELDKSFDLFFCIGGDGTILKSINYVKDLNIPIVGINTGRFGFLATLQKNGIEESLHKILNKEFFISKREVLCLQTDGDDEKLSGLNFALNDIVINRKNSTSMITVDTWLDGQYLTAYWADGLILTTATGSTGYSLSCGGPIISPQTGAIALTPIAPHNLNVRPLVIPSKTVIKLKVQTRADEFLVAMDSDMVSMKKDTELTIKKAPFTINLAMLDKERFITTLRRKLLWGEDKRNKKQ